MAALSHGLQENSCLVRIGSKVKANPVPEINSVFKNQYSCSNSAEDQNKLGISFDCLVSFLSAGVPVFRICHPAGLFFRKDRLLLFLQV